MKKRDDDGLPELAEELARTPERAINLHRLAAAGQIAAGVTHEARNALTGVIGFAQVAQRKLKALPGAGEVLELAEMIETESQRCVDILMGLLEFARPRDGTAGPVQVAEVVRTVERLAHGRLRMAGSTLHTQVAAPLPAVRGDAMLLTQVLLNLALNAMQAMPDGGAVRIDAAADGGGVRVAVSDEGPGVAPAVRAQLFAPFATTRRDGIGLGLFVSRAIVARDGGTLTLETGGERGATFVVRLPSWEEP